jgi:hypothetical protein
MFGVALLQGSLVVVVVVAQRGQRADPQLNPDRGSSRSARHRPLRTNSSD